MKKNLVVVVGDLCTLFPGMQIEDAQRFISLQLSVAIGLYPMFNLTEKQIRASQHVGMEHNEIHFKQEYRNAIMYIVEGLLKDRR
jgi:hypothetical protein